MHNQAPPSRPRLLVIGHARHGKDTVADLLASTFHLRAGSSSLFAAERCVRPGLAARGIEYATLEDCYADRVNHRAAWFDLIAAYNTPDPARLARELMERHDIYVGMRSMSELRAARAAELFDHIIWVEAGERLPPEPVASCQVTARQADWIVFNNGTLSDLVLAVAHLFTQITRTELSSTSPVSSEQRHVTT